MAGRPREWARSTADRRAGVQRYHRCRERRGHCYLHRQEAGPGSITSQCGGRGRFWRRSSESLFPTPGNRRRCRLATAHFGMQPAIVVRWTHLLVYQRSMCLAHFAVEAPRQGGSCKSKRWPGRSVKARGECVVTRSRALARRPVRYWLERRRMVLGAIGHQEPFETRPRYAAASTPAQRFIVLSSSRPQDLR